MSIYYNENAPFAVTWLKNLSFAEYIAHGVVDDRSIVDVRAADLAAAVQCHFFAGIGGWSYALRLAGWPDDVPVWTGSCPCQPFSQAGGQRGFADERHLWPVWFNLIRECRPPVVFGEQVASPAGLAWLDAVQADLEGAGYAVAAADLCAASVGAPHIRQRLFFVAYTNRAGCGEQWRRRLSRLGDASRRHDTDGRGADGARLVADGTRVGRGEGRQEARRDGAGSVDDGGVGDADGGAARQHARAVPRDEEEHDVGPALGDHTPLAAGGAGGVADAERDGSGARRSGGAVGGSALEPDRHGAALGVADADLVDAVDGGESRGGRLGEPAQDAPLGFWDAVTWIPCRDGKLRPVEPGTFPLAHGVRGRVGRLRAYGNAIVPQLAATFISAFIDTLEGDHDHG